MEDLLLDTADGFAKMKDSALAAVYADELFSDEGIRMLPILKLGREGIEAMAAKGLELSHVFSNDMAKASDDYLRAQQDVTTSAGGLKDAIGLALLPALTSVANKIVPVIVGLKDWAAENPNLVAAIGKVAVIILGAGGLLLGLSAVISIAPAVGVAVTLMTGPIGIAVVAVGAIVAGFILFGDQIKAVGLGLLAAFTLRLSEFVGAARWVAEALGFDGMAGSLSDLEHSLEGTGKEWKNTSEEMWEGKKAADEADESAVNLNATLGVQTDKLVKVKDEWDRLSSDLGNMAANELYKLEQAIENSGTALENLEGPTIAATDALSSSGGLADALAVVTAGADAAMLSIEAPNSSLMSALDTLGVKSTEMKNKELADLEFAMREIERAFEAGEVDLVTLQAAQQAYADGLAGANGSINKTDEWGPGA